MVFWIEIQISCLSFEVERRLACFGRFGVPEGLEGHQLVGLILDNCRAEKKKKELIEFPLYCYCFPFFNFEVECQAFYFVLLDGLFICLCCFTLK